MTKKTQKQRDTGAGRSERRRLGELLRDAKVLDDAQVEAVLAEMRPVERFGAAAQRMGLATESEIADAVSRQLHLPRIDIADEVIDPAAVERLPARVAARHEVVPLRIDGDTMVLAMADPLDIMALDDVRTAAKVRTVRPVVATPHALAESRRRVYRSDVTRDLLDEIEEEERPDPDAVEETEDYQPVVKLVDSVLADAIEARASDVHLEPDRDGLQVRIRVDGLLRQTAHVPRSLSAQVLSRLKIMARLDIAERRLPQDGRAVTRVDRQEVDMRVSTMPTLHGETVVLRLLPKGGSRVGIDALGLDGPVRARFLDALARPQGLVLVTGPTGSGKTTTLYAGLEAVADPTRNVLTLEDPIEVQLPGVNQTQIEPKIGLTFARGLRHVLRQDPDVVLVGEIRDRETAQLAVEAAFTGHLVVATLHTNDAPSSIARLIDLGADRFLIASSLLLVVAQRLARKVCGRCSAVNEPDPEVVRRLGLDPETAHAGAWRRGAGCNACEGTGTLGRIGVAECLPITPRLRELIMDGAAENVLSRQARVEGLHSLREDAIGRAVAGIIPLDEALRVTPDPSGDVARCPGCAEVVADDHLACPWCGTALALAHCPVCGRAVDAAWSTCPWCRHRLVDATEDAPGGA